MENEITTYDSQPGEIPTGKAAFPPNDRLITFPRIFHYRTVWACIMFITAVSGTMGYIWALEFARGRVEKEAFELGARNGSLIALAVDSSQGTVKKPETVGVHYQAATILFSLTTRARSGVVVRPPQFAQADERYPALDRFRY
jgi:hypothetical protein